ncbi:hypothetical protein [Herbaspirillum sp. RV1423]|nr:hypothetical protein [Herbaspirillum sp. RV1423]
MDFHQPSAAMEIHFASELFAQALLAFQTIGVCINVHLSSLATAFF